MATFTNPKNGDTIVTDLTMDDALDLCLHSGNRFAIDLASKALRWTPSEGQLFWIMKLAEEQKNPSAKVDKSVNLGMSIPSIFNTAIDKGVNKPRLRFVYEDFRMVLKRANETFCKPENIGMIYVTSKEGEESTGYYGKIDAEGRFHPAQKCNGKIVQLLKELAANPEEFVSVYGHTTGNCCFCSRELTDSRSVTAGYGPICASKWGLEWGKGTPQETEIPLEELTFTHATTGKVIHKEKVKK